MKKILIILFLLSICYLLFSAQSKIDNLELKLNTISGKKRIAILNELAAEYSPIKPQKAIEYANEALKFSKKNKQKKEEAFAYRNLADSYYYLNNYANSVEMYKKSAEIEKQISGEFSESYERRLGDIGFCYEMLLKFEEAIEVYQEALKIAEKLEISEEIVTLLSNIGQAYYKSANYDKALEYFQRTLKAELEFGKPQNLSINYNSIGMVYDAWQQYKKAIEYYKLALEIDKQYNNEGRAAIRMNNIGYAYRALHENEKALEYLQPALKIEKKFGRKDKIAIRLTNIGLIYISDQEYQKALNNFWEAESNLLKVNLPNYLSTLYNHIGHTFMLQKKYNKAKEFFDKSQQIAIEKDLIQQQIHNHREFAVLYSKIGNFQKAYQNQVTYAALKDSVFSEEKHRQLAEFEAKYKTEKKEKEIELLTKNSEIQLMVLNRQKTLRNIFIILFGIIIVVGFFIYKVKQREIRIQKEVEHHINELNKQLEQRVKDELNKREKQQNLLIQKSKLESLGKLAAGIAHEINQPLGGISMGLENLYFTHSENGLTKEYFENKLKTLKGYIDRINQIINHIRIFSRDQQSPLFEKIDVNEVIKNALTMVQTQYKNHNVQLNLHLDDNLGFSKGNKFKLEQVVLNLLSNAKDAVEECDTQDDKKQININTKREHSNLIIEIEDNGKGIKQENLDKIFDPFFTTKDPEKGTGLGLSIVYGIIKEMQGEISVESEINKFTRFTLTLPKI